MVHYSPNPTTHADAGKSCAAVFAPCGCKGRDNHCHTLTCPFRGFECDAISEKHSLDAHRRTCTYNVIDWNWNDGHKIFDGNSTCSKLCLQFGWECLRLEERDDNLCGGKRVAQYSCDQRIRGNTFKTSGSGHAFCTCAAPSSGRTTAASSPTTITTMAASTEPSDSRTTNKPSGTRTTTTAGSAPLDMKLAD